MQKNRLEAFSDGVFAIIITIMVLELKAPHEATWSALQPLAPKFLSYVLSYLHLGIYWNNHHHMLHMVRKVTGGVLWANLNVLFWLSLIPWATAFLGENHFHAVPVAIYGVLMLLAGTSYWILQQVIIRCDGPDAPLRAAIGSDWKGKSSPALYLLAVAASLWNPWVSMGVYLLVALMWLVPDRRIERIVSE